MFKTPLSLITLRKLLSQLHEYFSELILGRNELSLSGGMKRYLVDQMPMF